VSDYLAVAGVSAVLRSLLATALTSGGPSSILGATLGITATAPDLVPTGADEQPRVNLFMYYASLNSAYRNFDLPAFDSQGRRVSNPPLGLNLHYLVSAYGATQFDPEILLGWAMQVFHENAVVSKQTVQDAITALGIATPEAKLVSGSTLANQAEGLKITPEALSNEEISRLWMAFSTNYRPTTSYQVTVVLIQDTQPIKSNLPVQSRTVTVLPWQTPVIDNLSPSIIGTGELLTITGSNFVGDVTTDTLVAFDQGDPVAPDAIQGNTIRVKIPPTLQAGGRTVRVLKQGRFGVPTDPHRGFSSSPARFQLAPTITTAPPITVAAGSVLTLTLNPPAARDQQASVYVGDASVKIDARPLSDPATSTTLKFPIPGTWPPATSPLRVEIDGAQSRLTLDTTTGSPTFGQFLPQVQVTP
jgi:Pvc16 N-terminal domain/IPT/TIG domain